MQLLNLTTRRILILIFSTLLVWSVYFYMTLQSEINENMDEYLQNRKYEISLHLKKNQHVYDKNILPHTDFKIRKITKVDFDNGKDTFKDIDVFEGLEQEDEPYRQLETFIENEGNYYKLTIIASLMDKEELLATILQDVVILFLIIIALIIFLRKAVLQKLWNPFYSTLEKLKQYNLDKDPKVDFEETIVKEFNELNSTASTLIQKNFQMYQQQKQFIENASHEIQTPLAIAISKLEMLMQKKDLNKEEADLIQSVNYNLERLSNLNKSLLLLSKIENNQFHEFVNVDLGSLIDRLYQEFDTFAAFKKIKISIEKRFEPLICGNSILLEVLFRNLIKNAIYHNFEFGYVTIVIEENKIEVENTGPNLSVPAQVLFERFSKDSHNPESLGLGLSIVKSIVHLHNYSISYFQDKKIHRITILF